MLPALRPQPQATILTTSSGLAFGPRADFPTYCPSRAFLHSWIQSLRFQLKNMAVEVLELAPPYVQTELLGAAQATDLNAVPLADFIEEVMHLLEKGQTAAGEVLVERVSSFGRPSGGAGMMRPMPRSTAFADRPGKTGLGGCIRSQGSTEG